MLTLAKNNTIVLDPFAGSGTSLVVASNIGRNGIAYEINVEYGLVTKNRILNNENYNKDCWI